MFRDTIEKLLTFPQRGQVRVNFDLNRRVFRLSVPIFTNPRGLPEDVKQYVENRKKHVFRPFSTKYQLESNQVVLTQEFPFEFEFQETLRTRTDAFWNLSQTCHKMLLEIANEQKFKHPFFPHT